MTTAALLADLQHRGVELYAEGDRLRVRAAQGVVTPDDLARLRAEKSAVLAELVRARVARCGRLALEPDGRPCPVLLTCPTCRVTSWRPEGSRVCLSCQDAERARRPHPTAPPAPRTAVGRLAEQGVAVSLASDGTDLRTDPSSTRLSTTAFSMLVSEAETLRRELATAPEHVCRRCGGLFRAVGIGRYCGARCREAGQ